MSLLPLATFDFIEEREANQACEQWVHYLGACGRPFRQEWYGLFMDRTLVSVAISASTVGATCGGFERKQVVELARLVTHPDHRWATRLCIRLWRELAAPQWASWRPVAAISYSDKTRHKGDVYRFDGWTKVADVSGSTGGGTYSTKKQATPKAVWIYRLRVAA